ncbi:MAG: integration host factor subunit beta [Odoribacter sp.]|nr:integration host factor subunit beta [Odoribacter sp.]
MTKADIINKISKEKGVDKLQTTIVLEAFMDVVKEKMIDGNNVYLRGFGSFILKRRKQKLARNISKNTPLIIPEHDIPAFKPCKDFQKSIAIKS